MPNCFSLRWLGWALRVMFLSRQWAVCRVTTCFLLATVLTCSIPVAMSEMRGFCGHGVCQSCTSSAQPWLSGSIWASRKRAAMLGRPFRFFTIATIRFLYLQVSSLSVFSCPNLQLCDVILLLPAGKGSDPGNCLFLLYLWASTFCCISGADWLSTVSLKTSFPPLLELFFEPFTAFQLSFWSEKPRHGYVFQTANGE